MYYRLCIAGCSLLDSGCKRVKKNSGIEKWCLAVAFLSILIILSLKNIIHTSLLSAWVLAVPSASLLVGFYHDEGKAAEILHAKPFQVIGNISFELYMTHAFVHEGLPIAVGMINNNMKKWLVSHAGTRFIITATLSFLVAWIVNMILKAVNRKIVLI